MNDSSAADPRGHLMRQLRQQLGHRQTTFSTGEATPLFSSTFSSGTAALDRLLPGSGLRHGMLVEWLSEQAASGAATLSLLSAREASRAGGIVVVIDRPQTFYPPTAAAWDIDLDRLIVVHPRSAREELWATLQSLRSPIVAAVWAAIHRIDDRAFRRLQLAAEAGRTLGLLLRPASARGQPSWADVRLWMKGMEQGATQRVPGRVLFPAPCSSLPAFYRRIHVRVLRCHGGCPGNSAYLEIDDATHVIREVNPEVPGPTYSALSPNNDTHSLPVVAELADPTARPFSAGA
jgi:protein ImuA